MVLTTCFTLATKYPGRTCFLEQNCILNSSLHPWQTSPDTFEQAVKHKIPQSLFLCLSTPLHFIHCTTSTSSHLYMLIASESDGTEYIHNTNAYALSGIGKSLCQSIPASSSMSFSFSCWERFSSRVCWLKLRLPAPGSFCSAAL